MPDSPSFDEPDFDKHLRNVLQDLAEHTIDVEEAYEAITQHPGFEGGTVKVARLPIR